jgi:hypothetical protein
MVSIFRIAFPDLQLSVKDQVAEEDKVVTCYSGRITHQGELMGMPLPVMRCRWMGSSQAASPAAGSRKSRNNFDALGMMQLGVVTPPGVGWS